MWYDYSILPQKAGEIEVLRLKTIAFSILFTEIVSKK